MKDAIPSKGHNWFSDEDNQSIYCSQMFYDPGGSENYFYT